MLRLHLQLESMWRIWPIVTVCSCEGSTGKRISLPFCSLYILRDKVEVKP